MLKVVPATKREAVDLIAWSKYNGVELTAEQIAAVEKIWKKEGGL